MRTFLLTFGMICASTAALAQGTTPSSTAIVIKHDAAVARTGCDWIGADGKWKLAITDGNDRSKDSPADAYCWKARMFEFPGVMANEIHFTKKGVKTPVEFHAVDSFLYVEQGHAHNMLEGTIMDSSPGDAVFHNTGAWHQNEAMTDDYVQVEFKLPHATNDSNNPAVGKKGLDIDRFPRQIGAQIRNADVPGSDVCEVKTGGETKMVQRNAKTASTIPKDARCLNVKVVMARPSGRLIELRLPKGMKTEPHQNTPEDTLFRVVKGRVHFDGAGQSVDMNPGDMAYVPMGALHTFTVLDDAHLLETHYIPLAAR